jgi:hypothetical protein
VSTLASTCSTRLFQPPQPAQRPKNWRVLAPQAWQTKEVLERAKGRARCV